MVRYTSTRPDDAPLREAMKAVAAERRRFGYRRIHIMLDRQSIVMNQKKLRRLYREEKLQVRRRGDRRRALGTRRPMLVRIAPTPAGASTSSPTPSPKAVASGCWLSWTNTRGSAWRSSPTPRCRDCVWCANSTPSSAGAAGGTPSSPTTYYVRKQRQALANIAPITGRSQCCR
jgi:transposase InsO family protein